MNHCLHFYTKQLELLQNEKDDNTRYYSASLILSICKEKHKENLLSKDELMLVYIAHRAAINA